MARRRFLLELLLLSIGIVVLIAAVATYSWKPREVVIPAEERTFRVYVRSVDGETVFVTYIHPDSFNPDSIWFRNGSSCPPLSREEAISAARRYVDRLGHWPGATEDSDIYCWLESFDAYYGKYLWGVRFEFGREIAGFERIDITVLMDGTVLDLVPVER